MKTSISYRWFIGAFIALFFALQSFSVAHASSYGDTPHEHDGVACNVTVLADDQAIALPVAPIVDTVIEDTSETVYPTFTSALYVKPQTRAPPPRGPPSSL